jgi:hypothetical protein
MRTVTFSDLSVARAVHASCIPVWVNVDPGFHDCMGAAESQIWKGEPEIFPTRNIVTFFTTPDLRVLHYFSGYWHPEFFAKELDFVARLRRDVLRKDGRLRGDAFLNLRRAHRERADEIEPLVDYFERESGWSAALGPDPVHGAHVHGEACRSNLLQGLYHLADVHRSFYAGSPASWKIPRLSKLFYGNYRFGNPFAEGNFAGKPDRDLLSAMKAR